VKITPRVDDGSAVRLVLAGELDLATVDVLGEHLDRVVAGRPPGVVVDLAGVTFCDSSGVNALVQARTTALRHGVAFRAVNAAGICRRTLDLTGVLELLTAPATP
jgi:anti-sigma B factor antagonist